MRFFLLAVCVAFGAALSQPEALVSAASSDVRGVMRVDGKPQGNAVIWVEAPGAARPGEPAPVLDQRNLDFNPRVLAVQVGTVVDFPNNDRVFHNVFSFLNGKRFDLGLYPTGSKKRITFDKPGVSHLFCNIHPQMAAYVVVVDSPFFAVTDKDGRFTIRDLKAGKYTFHTWQAGKSVTTASETIGPDKLWEVK